MFGFNNLKKTTTKQTPQDSAESAHCSFDIFPMNNKPKAVPADWPGPENHVAHYFWQINPCGKPNHCTVKCVLLIVQLSVDGALLAFNADMGCQAFWAIISCGHLVCYISNDSDMARFTNMQYWIFAIEFHWQGFLRTVNRGCHDILCSIFTSAFSCQLFGPWQGSKCLWNTVHCETVINNMFPSTISTLLKTKSQRSLNKLHQIHHNLSCCMTVTNGLLVFRQKSNTVQMYCIDRLMTHLTVISSTVPLQWRW